MEKVVVQTGAKTYQIADQDGNDLGVFRFIPSDAGILKRYKEAAAFFAGINDRIKGKDFEEILPELEKEAGEALTNTLKISMENERMHGHSYATYTNTIYKAIFGKNAKQLREEYGMSAKDNIWNHLSEEELQLIQSKEMLVNGLIGCIGGTRQNPTYHSI